MTRGDHKRKQIRKILGCTAFLAVLCGSTARAQSTSPGTAPNGAGQGLAETLEAIAQARVTTRILYVTAHPDDESSSVLTYLARGLHADVALLSITRGEGGQNALGPEYGPRLAILRSEELLRATQIYGVKLFFTRASDFGFSKSPQEAMKVWGDGALADMVALIRTFRPHIIINNWGGVRTGHGHHQAAGLLTPQALEAAGDPQKYPEQIGSGLKAWKASYLLQLSRNFGTGTEPGSIPIPASDISPLWGRSYNEIGLDGFVNHRTQGIVGFRSSRFFRGTRSLVRAEGKPIQEDSLAKPLESLAEEFPALAPLIRSGLKNAAQQLREADTEVRINNWTSAVMQLDTVSAYLREARTKVQTSDAEAREDCSWELDRAIARVDQALALTAGLRLEAEAERSELVAGEKFTVHAGWQARPAAGIKLGEPELVLPAGWRVIDKAAEEGGLQFKVEIPPGAKVPITPDAWMYPGPPALVRARMKATADGHTFIVEEEVKAMRTSSTRADVVPLALVPEVTLTLEPKQFVVPMDHATRPLELLARVHHYGTQAAEFSVGVNVPAGWQSSATQALRFAGAGDELVRFSVTPPAKPVAGRFALRAYARAADGTEYGASLEPLPTLPSRTYNEPAQALVQVFPLAVPAGLRIGYVAAENDPLPEPLRQIGVQVELLDEVALAFGDLKKFDAVAIGIRAYELRGDMARANARLLDYAAAGGTLLVQYQRSVDWDRVQPAPYPATMGNATIRVADENSPVRIVDPANPALNFPNKIAAADFDGWIQERGLYFMGKFDAKFQALLGMHDPGEEEQLGGLLYARHGQGVYIYTGLSFFRQLPEGVPGACRLLVNLLSQRKKQGVGNRD